MIRALRAPVTVAALAGLALATPASGAVNPSQVLTVECVWHWGVYRVTRVDQSGMDPVSVNVGDSCGAAITDFVNANSVSVLVKGPSSTLGHHTYVLVYLPGVK